MDEKVIAAFKAGVDSTQPAERQERLEQFAGELCALDMAFNALLRRAKPEARAEVAELIRRMLLTDPTDPLPAFDEGYTSAATKLLTQLAGS